MPALLTAQRSIGGSGGPSVKVERAPVHARQCRSTTSRKGQRGAAFACPPQTGFSFVVCLREVSSRCGFQKHVWHPSGRKRPCKGAKGNSGGLGEKARTVTTCGRSEGTERGKMMARGRSEGTERRRMVARGRSARTERGRMVAGGRSAGTERGKMMACGRSAGTERGKNDGMRSFRRNGAGEKWWAVRGSNPRPSRCKRDALPAELTALACPVTGPRHETTCLRSRAANLQAGCGPFALFRRHTQTPGRRTSGCLVFSNTMPDLLAKRVLHGMPSR